MNPKTIRMLNKVRLAHRRIDTSSLPSLEKEEAENLFRQIISTAKAHPPENPFLKVRQGCGGSVKSILVDTEKEMEYDCCTPEN